MNSIIQFVRIVTKILEKYIPHVYLFFMNDIGVKGPKTTYNNEKIIFKIRKYILEHIIWINGILADLKRTRYTISEIKSQFYMPKLRVIGFICDTLKRYPNIFKVIKIIKWFFPNNIAEARAFVKMTVYYVGIWTYGELPCRQGLGPTGGSHATRGCSLLVAARSSWKHVDGGRLRQSGSMAKHAFPL
jgi:hypothetical protein